MIPPFFQKFQGDQQALPKPYGLKAALLAGLGGIIAIGAVGLLKTSTDNAWVLGSFGATCVLVFGFPDVPFSQPRNVVIGHVLSSLTGLVFFYGLSDAWWSMALAVGVAITLMMITRTVHPPAGSNPVIVFLTRPDWGFLLFPSLLGALAVLGVALFYNNLIRKSRYPKYW